MAMVIQPTKYVVASEAGVERTDLSAQSWLNSSPRGAYTTMRTVKKTRVYLLSFHLQRLTTSARFLIPASENDACEKHNSTVINESTLRPNFIKVVQAGLNAYQESESYEDEEAKVTVLVHWELKTFKVMAHVGPLRKPPSAPVIVKVVSALRNSAQIKDSSWVRDRQLLESEMTGDIEETVMCDAAHGQLLEGLSSNFFVYINNEIQTAGEQVLQGSVRAAALRAAATLHIPTCLTPPMLQESNHWQGAFLTSTSRLLLPVNKIIGLAALGFSDVEFELIQPDIDHLRLAVEEDIVRNSEPIL